MNQQDLSTKNLGSEIFTVSILADELERMWNTRRDAVREIAREIAARKPRILIFCGSGGSVAALYTGYYAMLRYSRIPASYLISPEIVSANPAILNEEAVAISASYSGKTVDTLAAKRILQERKVPLLAVTRRSDAELARGAKWSLTYDSRALFSSPAYLMLLLVAELCRELNMSEQAEALEENLSSLPSLLRKIDEASRQLAEENASELDDGKILVLAGGGCYGLGHMMAYDMFGEYCKEFCGFIHYGEFRHGPLEIVRPGEPTMMFLLGNDGARPYGEAAMNFGRTHGARVVACDAAQLAPEAHPLLDVFILYQSQLWLLYFMACRRNIDLDQYKYMHVVPYTSGDTFF